MRSLSNVIKSYAVRYENEMRKTIDTHLRIDKKLEQRIIPVKIITDINEHKEMDEQGFVEGIKAAVVEQAPTEEEQKEKADKILEDAKAEAAKILEDAKKEADKIKNDAFASAQKKGYEDGISQGNMKTQKLTKELEEKKKKLQEDYDRQISEIEPEMVKIMSSLIEKITGILVNNHQDVILYLVNQTLKNMDKSNEYTVRVSKEDFELVTARKDDLNDSIGDAVLNINEDLNLKKNQCMIETGQCVIDCSLDVQLDNLITDLKLLGCA